MPNRKWVGSGGLVFHALNRAAGGWPLFQTDDDYSMFLEVLEEALTTAPIRILAYTLMPNHWHLILWPQTDDELTEFLQWATMTHALRWHQAHGTSGRGALYQGRFKAFPIQTDDHFYTVCRYVERNALRAGLVSRAERWRWSSLWQRYQERADVSLTAWPLPIGSDWVEYVNRPQSEAELLRVRKSIQGSLPFGDDIWRKSTATRLDLKDEQRPRGRRPKPE